MNNDYNVTIERHYVNGVATVETYDFMSYATAMRYVDMCKSQASFKTAFIKKSKYKA